MDKVVKNCVLLVNEIKLDNICLTKPQECKTRDGKPSAQLESLIKYDDNNSKTMLCIQTPQFPLVSLGLMSEKYM
jgi:hypothetical protein